MKKTLFSLTIGIVATGALGLVAIRAVRPLPAPASTLAAPIAARLEVVSDQIELPSVMATTGDGSNRLYICEQVGRIRLMDNKKLQSKPVLDLQKVIVKNRGYDERGLLGLAFHPDFRRNNKFYVYYSARSGRGGANHKSVIEEYRMRPNDPTTADTSSGRIVLEFDQPESNHNGGDIKFGPDGFLYIASGDGGGGGDKHGEIGNGQNLNTLLGKILRIDVNKTPYGIPADNPFVNRSDARKEIYAYGLRNPWRISFDRTSGRLFAGDVGQNLFEEIDLVKKGGNYGWRIREGFHEFDSKQKAADLQEPITEYPHGPEGISIAGGFVYRGSGAPQLAGKYVFGDFIGPTYYLSEEADGKWTRGPLKFANQPEQWQIYSFGEDNRGELYVLAVLPGDKGMVYRVVR